MNYLCNPMFKIDQHIEYLLLNHNCVIVPGFGGFVVHEVPARYDESDGMMLPPATTVGFNPQLTINDSLLIQSFVEAYDMSYPEALREVEHETEKMKELIADNNSFDIHSVGTLSINAEGYYEFEPCQAGILVPRLYGLSGIDTNDNEAFALLKKSKVVTPAPAAEIVPEEENAEEETDEEKVFSISAKTLKRVAAACIAIMFLAAIPFIAQNKETQQMLSSIDLSFFTKFLPSTEVQKPEATAKPAAPVVKKVAPEVKQEVAEPAKTETADVENAETQTAKAEATQKAVEQPKAEPVGPVYTVVVAARVSKTNAENYVEKLKGEGYKDARVIGEGKARKVVIGTFKSDKEARQYQSELAVSEEFSAAWVVEVK